MHKTFYLEIISTSSLIDLLNRKKGSKKIARRPDLRGAGLARQNSALTAHGARKTDLKGCQAGPDCQWAGAPKR
jgi:hypothetical protein